MKKLKTRVLSFVLAITLAVGLVPMTAVAVKAETVTDISNAAGLKAIEKTRRCLPADGRPHTGQLDTDFIRPGDFYIWMEMDIRSHFQEQRCLSLFPKRSR